MTGKLALCMVGLLAVPGHGQTSATTTDGRVVLLAPDGIWSYAAHNVSATTATGTRSAAATAALDLWQGKGVLYFDPQKWHVRASDEQGVLSLAYAKGGAANIIVERSVISLDSLRRAALANAPDVRVVAERMVRVNGREVLEMQLGGTASGVRFAVLGYYFAGEAGTVRIVATTFANMFDDYRSDFQELLNGLTVR